METRFKIRELKEGLEIQCWRRQEYPRIFAALAVVMLLVGVVYGISSKNVLSMILFFALAMVFLLTALFRGQEGRLQVTKFEFTGTSPKKGKSGTGRVHVNTGDVRWLEYRDGGVFGILEFGTAGIYAVQNRGAKCLLPLVDFKQAGIIIQAIEAKFPGLAEMWRSNLQASRQSERSER